MSITIGTSLSARTAADLGPGELREHQVEHDEVEPVVEGRRQSGLAVRPAVDLVTLALQRIRDGVHDPLVVDDEDAFSHERLTTAAGKVATTRVPWSPDPISLAAERPHRLRRDRNPEPEAFALCGGIAVEALKAPVARKIRAGTRIASPRGGPARRQAGAQDDLALDGVLRGVLDEVPDRLLQEVAVCQRREVERAIDANSDSSPGCTARLISDSRGRSGTTSTAGGSDSACARASNSKARVRRTSRVHCRSRCARKRSRVSDPPSRHPG